MLALEKFFDMLPGWLWAILLAVALAACVALKLDLDHTKVVLAETKTAAATLKAANEQAARELSEARRANDDLRTKAAQEINDVVDEERSKTAAAVHDGNDARSMLIDATRRFAARGGSNSDPAALSRAEARAAAFGELLGTCDQVAGDLGRDAEDLATQVRGLQLSYQSLISTNVVLLFTRPLGDGMQVDPHVRSWRRVVVNAPLPLVALDAHLDR